MKRPQPANVPAADGDEAPAATGQPPNEDAAQRHPSIANMGNRVTMDDNGELDEVVTDGGCHLERMSKKGWFLNCLRADGSSYAVWFRGKITLTEERESPGYPWPKAQPQPAKIAWTVLGEDDLCFKHPWPRADSGVE